MVPVARPAQPRAYGVTRITLTIPPRPSRLWFARFHGGLKMPDIHQIELEHESDSGVQVVRGGGHGELPVDDPPPAEHPEENPPDSEKEVQARETEQAFERAIVRLPAG
jgi:hypothetical protein